MRLLGAAARTQWAGGTEHSSRRTVAQPAPRFAIRPRMGGARPVSTHPGPRKRRGGSGGPRQLPGGTARRRPQAGARCRRSPPPVRPRRAAGSGPEPPRPSPGGRPLPRPLPPPGRPRHGPLPPRSPRPAAPPPVGPREEPRISQAGSGAAGGRRAPALARLLLPGFSAHLRHIGTFRANEQRRAQSPDGAPEPIAAAAAAAAAVRPAPARRRRRLGPL